MTKKQHIIEVATELFNQYGYHVVGVDLIIKEAGVSKKTMYRYFQSKANLIIEVLQQRQILCATSLKQRIQHEADNFKKLELVFEWHNEWFNSTTFTGCLFAKAATEFPNKSEEAYQIAMQQKAELMATIEQLLPLTHKHLAPVLIMLLDGATLSAQVLGDKKAALKAWETAQNLILK